MHQIRNTIGLSVITQNGISCLRFSGIPKLSGHKGTLRFPRDPSVTLFVQIEDIMTVNGMCHNVTQVEKYGERDGCHMFTVTYNRPQTKTTKK